VTPAATQASHVSPARDVFAAIASPVRRQLLDALWAGPLAVRDLAASFEVSRPAVSQHLAVLRAAELVTEERVGRERRYRLDPRPLREVQTWVAHYERFWTERLTALRDVLGEQP
jgi:DNA-binding transcriptional ArsR family regulator